MSFVFLLCNKVEASGSVLGLHTKTKIYSSNDEDYYDGCEDFNDYDESLPTITVLNHGLGGQYFHWSNKYNVDGGRKFVYNSHSIVEKLYQHLNGNLSIYVAKAESDLIIDNATNSIESYEYNRYKLYKVSHFDYVSNANNEVQVDYLDDVSKHILILFNSNDKTSFSTHAIVYEEFHNVLDDISYQYKLLTGVLPRYNLIGHSRGGVINLMYATEHIYNVHSLYSLGTPYNGAVLGNIDPIMEVFGYYIKDSAGNTVVNANYTGENVNLQLWDLDEP